MSDRETDSTLRSSLKTIHHPFLLHLGAALQFLFASFRNVSDTLDRVGWADPPTARRRLVPSIQIVETDCLLMFPSDDVLQWQLDRERWDRTTITPAVGQQLC